MAPINIISKATGGMIVAMAASLHASSWELNSDEERSILFAKDANGASIALTCSDSLGVQATVYLDGNEIDQLTVKTPGRLATRRVTLDTDSTEPRSGRWIYIRSGRTLISAEAWQGKRIYNAVVTNSPISMSVRRVGDFSLELPAIDDNFRSFSSMCL